MRLLVVEDETRMAALLRRGLQEEGYAVDVAADGVQALWQAGEYDYDAIVLDGILPGLDGFEVCRRIRARGLWARVLLLTARDGLEKPGPGAGRRCRRLPGQAVPLRRTHRAAAGGAAAGPAATSHGVGVRGLRTGSGDPDGMPRRPARRAHEQGGRCCVAGGRGRRKRLSWQVGQMVRASSVNAAATRSRLPTSVASS